MTTLDDEGTKILALEAIVSAVQLAVRGTDSLFMAKQVVTSERGREVLKQGGIGVSDLTDDDLLNIGIAIDTAKVTVAPHWDDVIVPEIEEGK